MRFYAIGWNGTLDTLNAYRNSVVHNYYGKIPTNKIEQFLTRELHNELKCDYPHVAQLNTSYFSRSDEYGLMRWSRVLGLFGIPAKNIHLGKEECNIRDIVSGVFFFVNYIIELLKE
mgnify:FL=1